MKSMKKIKLDEGIRKTTMFLNDETIEKKYENAIKTKIVAYKKMSDISTREGLESFIRSTPDSIEMLITLLGIAVEKFKRVVTMLRVEKGYTFDSEWPERRVQKELCEKPDFMREFCELFLNGCKIDRYKKKIPYLVLQDFCIDNNTIDRLRNEDMLRKLIKNSCLTRYNKEYGDLYAEKIQTFLKSQAEKYGLHYTVGPIDEIGKGNLHAITNTENYLIVTFQYNVTTSKGQTTYADNTIYPIWQKSRTNKEYFTVVNMLDGAGWVARASDYRKVYNYCDYFLNLNTLDELEKIIKQTFNIQ